MEFQFEIEEVRVAVEGDSYEDALEKLEKDYYVNPLNYESIFEIEDTLIK